jgi:3-methyladenine DNA glycosylase AlkC
MEEGFQLREVINEKVVAKIAKDIHRAWAGFDKAGFINAINPNLSSLSFNNRSLLITKNLQHFLPDDYPEAIKIILHSFGPELETDELSGFDIFYYMPHGSFVAKYGLAPEHFEISMTALYELTKRFSSESPIRPFLIKYPDKTLTKLKTWVKDKNLHVRRLVSEGTRPRLPLARRLPAFQKNPEPVIELLEELKTDPVLYVRRSVANNFNDIGKDNPEIVIDIFRRWQKNGDKGTQWIIKHALRSLVKEGTKGALEILGFSANPKINIAGFKLCVDQISIGQYLEFSFKITSLSPNPQKIMIDFIIHFKKANGKLAPKVFKLSQKEILPGETLEISKKHSFKKISTRTYYLGTHSIELQINGQKFGSLDFNLISND